MPLLTKRRILAAKAESTPGTAESLGNADAAMNIFEATMQTTAEFVARIGQGSVSPLPGMFGAMTGTCTFTIELYFGSPVPKEMALFLPACGFKNTSGTFSLDPKTPDIAGSGLKTLTIGLYEDGVLKELRGCSGNVEFTFPSARRVTAQFTFSGVLVLDANDKWQTTAALLTPTYPDKTPLKFEDAELTFGSWSPTIEQLTINMNNSVQPRYDPTFPLGIRYFHITDRNITGTINPESEAAGSFDLYQSYAKRTTMALDFTLQTSASDPDAGKTINFNAPAVQVTNPQEGDRDGAQIDDIELLFTRGTDDGDDELTITVAS